METKEKSEKDCWLNEFFDLYCAVCGSQRCGGIHDERYREGCQIWNKNKSEEGRASDFPVRLA